MAKQNGSGWIKLHRKLQDNPIWTSEPFTRGQAWVDLILLANREKGYLFVRDHRIDLERGDVGWSQNRLSERWSWSRTKVNSFLNLLEKEQQIKQLKSHSYTVIRLINYNQYQSKEQQKDNRKTTVKQQKDTNKKEEKEENEKESIYGFEKFWDDYGKKNDKAKCKAKYEKIGEHDRAIIREHVPRYVASTPDEKYRKNPLTYLNGKNWEDEITMPKYNNATNLEDLIDHRIYT
jgi:hypothetical protein